MSNHSYPARGDGVNAVHIPVLEDGINNLDAALRYAAAGIYVLPTDPAVDVKNPGSVVRGRWHDKSSRDRNRIQRWFAGHPDRGIALHCKPSGLIVFDVDHPARVPDLLARHLGAAAYQPTRPDTPGRGHYAFAIPPGATFTNSCPEALDTGWGDVNAVIIATPTPHRDGGRYGPWQRTGAVPVLPDELTDALMPEPAAEPQADHSGGMGAGSGSPPRNGTGATRSADELKPWARAVIDGELVKVRTAAEEDRNKTLNRCALRCFRAAMRAELDLDEVADDCSTPPASPGAPVVIRTPTPRSPTPCVRRSKARTATGRPTPTTRTTTTSPRSAPTRSGRRQTRKRPRFGPMAKKL